MFSLRQYVEFKTEKLFNQVFDFFFTCQLFGTNLPLILLVFPRHFVEMIRLC